MKTREKWLSYLLLLIAFVILTGFLFIKTGTDPLKPSPYNTYTLQALAWRDGRAWLNEDIPHLELAIYQGKYFVSFPPVPSVPVYFLSFIFGSEVPDGLLVLFYAFVSLITFFRILIRHGFPPLSSALYAFLILFASSFLPLVLSGAVWYQAQVMAMMLTLLSIDFINRDRTTPGLLFYALAVGCRPFNALYGPLLLILYIRSRLKDHLSLKLTLKRLLPGVLIGLVVAVLYAWYNCIRFNNPLEFGHNHLPEFSFQGGTQFSLSHVIKNVKTFVLGLPFERTDAGLRLKAFGFSLLIANPALLLMLVSAVNLLVRKQLTTNHLLVLAFFFLHLFLLLTHRTFGGYQYGARYATDLLPYAVLFLISGKPEKIHIAKAAVLFLGLALAVYGSLVIHL
ncbi:MAG: hypothetical protein QM308_00210 [Bacillota bacterium]|nr:hypothetical protein [Bacillota bacterium]